MSRTPAVLGQIDQILSSIEASHNKTAAARTEPGSVGGATTHPSKDVDDRTSKATEGFRSKENEQDVSRATGGPGVNNASDAKPGSAESAQYNIGLTAKPTGEDPKNETSSAKGGKSDGGTYDGSSKHPARTDNDSIDGHKYAGINDAINVLRQRTKSAQVIGTELLSQLAVAASTPETKQAAPAESQAQAGYDFAGVVTPDFDKQSLDNVVVQSIAETIAIAEDQALKTAEYLDTFFANLQKQAEEGEEEGDLGESEGGDEPDGDEAGALALPPEAGADAGAGDPADALQGIDPQVLQQLLQLLLAQQGGGGDPGAGGGDPGAAEGDPSAMLQGGQSMGGQGAVAGMGAPADDTSGGLPPGGDAGGGMPPEAGMEHMAMLHQAMIDAGTNPDEVEALAAKQAAASLKAWRTKQAGKAQTWRPKNASQAKAAQEATAYLKELVGRNR